MNNLGYIYRSGLGTPKDNSEAFKWYQKSAYLGSMKARNMLALYYTQEIGDYPVDVRKALGLLEASACQGYAVAQNNLGIIYSKGIGEFPKNYKLAYAWFSVAFSNGHENARRSLDDVAKKLTPQELEQARILANEYIVKYSSSMIEDDTYKSNTECKYP